MLTWWVVAAAIGGSASILFYLLKWHRYRQIATFTGRLLGRENYARRKSQLSPLGRVRFLDKVAARQSKSMAKRKSCDHHGFDKRAAIIKDKMGLSYVAENCYLFRAKTYNDHVAKELVTGWLKSPGHRSNLMNPRFKRTGIGIVVKRGYVYATQIFTD